MDCSTTIAQLRAAATSLADRIGGAAQFQAGADDPDLVVPCAFVVSLGEIVEDDQAAGAVVQEMEEQIGVIVAVDNTVDLRGGEASATLAAIRAELLAALLGFEPFALYSPFEYRGSTLLEMQRNRVWMQFDFASKTVIGS